MRAHERERAVACALGVWYTDRAGVSPRGVAKSVGGTLPKGGEASAHILYCFPTENADILLVFSVIALPSPLNVALLRLVPAA